MTKQELLVKVINFRTLLKEVKKLGSLPSYRYQQEESLGEEFIENLKQEFNIVREDIIKTFNIKGTNHHQGRGLDAQQIAERYITEQYVNNL